MPEIKDTVERLKKNELMAIDMRPFEHYMKGHIPESILAPYVEDRWGYEISNFIDSNKGELILLYESEEEKTKGLEELKGFGKTLTAFQYEHFLVESGLKEASAVNITSEEYERRSDEYQVLDVREPQEWATGTIDGAELISLNDLFTDHVKLDKSKKYAVICEHGNRSLYGAIFLADKGFEVANITDGMEGLRRRGII